MRFFSFLLKLICVSLIFTFVIFLFPCIHPELDIAIPSNATNELKIARFSPVIYSFGKLFINPSKIKFGVYKVKRNSNLLRVIRIIQKNKQVSLPLKIKNGASSAEIRVQMASSANFRGAIPDEVPEGAILPNIYCFAYGTLRSKVIDHILKQSKIARDKLWKENRLFKDENEWITFASILEKEGFCYDDKRRIAGVLLNRIKKKMRLQVCATAIYIKTKGMYDQIVTWQEICSKKFSSDADYFSPYNTYAHKGFPPGPICNPGAESLLAALNPEAHDYYYYRVIDGQHVFSRTFDEHKSLMDLKNNK